MPKIFKKGDIAYWTSYGPTCKLCRDRPSIEISTRVIDDYREVIMAAECYNLVPMENPKPFTDWASTMNLKKTLQEQLDKNNLPADMQTGVYCAPCCRGLSRMCNEIPSLKAHIPGFIKSPILEMFDDGDLEA